MECEFTPVGEEKNEYDDGRRYNVVGLSLKDGVPTNVDISLIVSNDLRQVEKTYENLNLKKREKLERYLKVKYFKERYDSTYTSVLMCFKLDRGLNNQ